MGLPRKNYTKEQILSAMDKTKSVRACARYLNCSYQHLKPIMKFYEATEPGYKNLFEQHKNQCGKGIPKFLSNGKSKGDFSIADILEGRVDPVSFNPGKIKYKLIQEGYLKEECYTCGFHEHRVLDYKMPLILNFKDGNKMRYVLDNLEMLCYNCYFLYQGDIFTNRQLEAFEDHVPMKKAEFDWEVDSYTQQRLEELGLYDPKPLDDGSEYISRL
jgi:hypothetical protein